MRRGPLSTVLVHAAALLVLVTTLAPIAWLALMSVATPAELVTKPLRWLPASVDMARFQRLLDPEPNSAGLAFLMGLRNSLGAAAAATLVALAVGIPAAWAFARVPGGHRRLLPGVLALTMMPVVALTVPLYMALAALGLLNSVAGLAVVYSALLTPFAVWLLKAAIDAVPAELEAAALVDGAGLWQTLRHVTLPLARGEIVTAALFTLLAAWDEFFLALLFTSNAQAKTLTVTLADLTAGRATDFGLVAAAALLASVPPVLIGFVLQRALVSGLLAGGVKE